MLRFAPTVTVGMARLGGHRVVIQMLLKINKRLTDIFNPAQYFSRIRNSIIFQLKQAWQFFLIKFPYAGFNIFGQHKFQKFLLFIIQ